MKALLFLFISLVSFGVYAQDANTRQDFDNSNNELDAFYQRGAYLIYDCVTNHWVCTKKLEYKRCDQLRKRALLERENRLPCAKFDQFKSTELCHKELLRLTSDARGDRFCLHPLEQQRRRDF